MLAERTVTSARKVLCVVARRAAYSTTATTMQSSQSVADATRLQKIDARVFCLGKEGGNPVTIFAAPLPLSGSLQQRLAKSCNWESVMVGTEQSSSIMAFFMPSGEEVSFCAHAAIGGAIAMGGGSWDFEASMTRETFQVDVGDGDSMGADGGSCRLQMKDVQFEEAPLSKAGKSALLEWSGRLGWAVASQQTPINASVARPKTLIQVESVEAVHSARTPPIDGSFAQGCTTMDDSTGVYLYAPKPPLQINSYECRQFPRSSGYPEDPATGIAAAALAASLRFGGSGITGKKDSFDIYQGTAMGRPSLIQVFDLERDDDGKLSFGLQGRVEIDATCTMEVCE